VQVAKTLSTNIDLYIIKCTLKLSHALVAEADILSAVYLTRLFFNRIYGNYPPGFSVFGLVYCNKALHLPSFIVPDNQLQA